LPAHIVHEDDDCLAFLDIHPVRPGHTLIVPKQHYPYFEDMPPQTVARIMAIGQTLATQMKRIYSVERVAFAFTGIHVAHAHAHIVPMHRAHDVTSTHYIAQKHLSFIMPEQAPKHELSITAKQLRASLHTGP
jgi:histidine triad (HIT) family protein